jgi:hypothetical protein
MNERNGWAQKQASEWGMKCDVCVRFLEGIQQVYTFSLNIPFACTRKLMAELARREIWLA